MRYGYPLVLRGMEKVRSRVRPWMTVLLAVFMAVNMLTSALALARYDARTSGEGPKTASIRCWTTILMTPVWSASIPTRRKWPRLDEISTFLLHFGAKIGIILSG